MARKQTRRVTTYQSTRAKGEQSTPITDDRYFIKVDLVSCKVEESADVASRSSEVYFKTERKRIPNKGYAKIEINEVFTPTDGITLYSEFIEKKGGGSKVLKFQVFDRDIGSDDELIDEKISVVLGQSREYLAFSNGGLKVKIAVSAKKTRY